MIAKGDVIDVGGGETRTIDYLGLKGGAPYYYYGPNNEDGKGSPFNDRGEFLFYAAWSQPEPGAGYFVASQFRVHTIAANGTDIEITFPSRSANFYRLLTRESLSDSTWIPQVTTFQGQPWTTKVVFPQPGHDLYFRISREP